MLVPRLDDLRSRLDALKEGRVASEGFLAKALARFGNEAAPTQAVLRELDRELDRAGVHTAADARLLKQLGALKGRLVVLTQGLLARATAALLEFEAGLKHIERLTVAGERPAGQVSALEADFVRLARILKVSDLFESPMEKPAQGFEIFARSPGTGASGAAERPPATARLAVAAFFAERARANVEDMARKRRDLDLAHELLLRVGSLAKEDRDGARVLRLSVAEARERVKAAPVVRSLVDLTRHLRHVARRDPRTAYRSLKSLYERAVEAGEGELAAVAHQAVSALLPAASATAALVEQSDLQRLVGWRDDGRPLEGAPGDRLRPGGRTGVDDTTADTLAELAFALDPEKVAALELAIGCGRFFDVEDALSEEFVEAELKSSRPVQRRVSYPTQALSYEFTGSLDEIHNFVISHPQTLVLDLAANRQMVRAYLDEEPPPRPKAMKKTSVRVYVLDASGSMYGPRARFRDAILIAELNGIRVKARQGKPFDPLYFSYFNDAPTELSRVDNATEATRQMEKLFRSSPAEGQTDISLALMSAFDSIKAAQGKDPYLARATVVLVTDGEDRVDLELIRRTKKPFEGLDIALSFIALGEENPDLRSLVLEQRRAGGRAFYHHLGDAEIKAVRTEFDVGFRTLLPPDVPATGPVLEALAPHLEALEALAQGRPARPLVRADSQFEALFPPPPDAAGPAREGALEVRLLDVLDAVGEAASLAPADSRASEAVTLLTHLLELYEVPLSKYQEQLARPSLKLKEALERVRLLCKPFA